LIFFEKKKKKKTSILSTTEFYVPNGQRPHEKEYSKTKEFKFFLKSR